MEESITFAKKYLEDLLSFFGLNTDVYATSDEEVIELSVPSTHMNGFLIGQHGETVRSLQYLVSTALSNGGYTCTRVNVDIADYKKSRQDRLAQQSLVWIERVKSSGKPYELQPMNAADRRIIHKVAGEHGLSTESTGFGRDRRVVLSPASGDKNDVYEDEEVTEVKEASPEQPEVAGEKTPHVRKKPTDKAKDVTEFLAKEEAKDTSAEPTEAKPKKGLLGKIAKKVSKNAKTNP
jgi:spoIIIJ-associated protein